MKWLRSPLANLLFFLVNLALMALAIYFVSSRGINNDGWSSSELLTVMLAALGVMIAVLTLFLGGLAIWGYTQLESEARRIADQTAKRVAEETAKKRVDETLPEMVASLNRDIGSEDRGYGEQVSKEDGHGNNA